MRHSALVSVLFCLVMLTAPAALCAKDRPCVTPADALKHINKDVCVAAHVYNVVELSDGTRFLDVCSSDTTDEQCRFSIVSRAEDRPDVGDLTALREQDIHIRGTVRPFAGRSEIVLSNVRQLHGGAEKFRPNPALISGFSADRAKPGFNDKALASVQHKGSFNTAH
jgi:hypothetical protein